MKKQSPVLISVMIVMLIMNYSCSNSRDKEKNRTVSFDSNWLFIKDNPTGAENPSFDDSGWRKIDLPHDWSIEDLPNQSDSVIGPFSKADGGKMRTGYTVGGTAWYRKTFTIDKSESKKSVYLMFEGVYMNSDVWINGKHAGNHPYGYTSFYYDITSYLNPAGQPNVVAVQVKNEGENARWYSGSGIYRHTWLTMVEPIHVGMWGVFVKTPIVSAEKAEANITSTIVNTGEENSPVKVRVDILDLDGKVVGTSTTDTEISPKS
jgi:beta-galactosidase